MFDIIIKALPFFLLCIVEASADWVCGNLLLSDGNPHPLHQICFALLGEAIAIWVCGNLLLSDGNPHPLHQLCFALFSRGQC